MPVELDSPVTEEGLPRVTTAQELNTEQPPPIPATALPGTPSVVRDTSDEKEETEVGPRAFVIVSSSAACKLFYNVFVDLTDDLVLGSGCLVHQQLSLCSFILLI